MSLYRFGRRVHATTGKGDNVSVDNSPNEFKPNDLQELDNTEVNDLSIYDIDDAHPNNTLQIGDPGIDGVLNTPVMPTEMTGDLEPGTDTIDPMVNIEPERDVSEMEPFYDPNVTTNNGNMVARVVARLRHTLKD
ncbi:hypothetical protein [Burkholderia phage BCSR5]|nr:hypothetical protein [Burkholderia phage BCSR5]